VGSATALYRAVLTSLCCYPNAFHRGNRFRSGAVESYGTTQRRTEEGAVSLSLGFAELVLSNAIIVVLIRISTALVRASACILVEQPNTRRLSEYLQQMPCWARRTVEDKKHPQGSLATSSINPCSKFIIITSSRRHMQKSYVLICTSQASWVAYVPRRHLPATGSRPACRF